MQAAWYQQASDVERQAAEHVIDHNAAEATCPACLQIFATGPEECPNCGLRIK